MKAAHAVLLLAITAAACRPAAAWGSSPSNYGSNYGSGYKSWDRCDTKTADAMAISIVFSVCNGSITAVSEAMASASVSGCGDVFAAGIGIGVSSVTPDIDGFVANAFTASLTIANSKGAAAAASTSLAIAIASIDPTYSVYPVDKLLDDIAVASQNVAVQTRNCQASSQICTSFYKTLMSVAPDLADDFGRKVADRLKACPILRFLGLVAGSYSSQIDYWVRSATSEITGGKGSGYIKKRIFNSDIQTKKSSSALAVTIANVSCIANGGSIAAVAIATASIKDGKVASNAISAAIIQGVDITETATATFLQPYGVSRDAAITSFAEALIITDEDTAAQTRLATYLSAAIRQVVSRAGCTVAGQAVDLFQTALAGNSALVDKLCAAIPAGAQLCGSATCIWRQ